MTTPIYLGLNGFENSFIWDAEAKEFEKIANGIGRFNMLDGEAPYGLQRINDSDDMIGTLMSNLFETNKSLKSYDKIRTQE